MLGNRPIETQAHLKNLQKDGLLLTLLPRALRYSAQLHSGRQ
jgi:hypothetical protein